jgi:hypothetical protein
MFKNTITPAIKDMNKHYSTALDSGTRALQGIRVFAGMTTLAYLVAGVIKWDRKNFR